MPTATSSHATVSDANPTKTVTSDSAAPTVIALYSSAVSSRPDEAKHVDASEYAPGEGREQARERQRAHQRKVALRGPNHVHHGHDEGNGPEDQCQQRKQAGLSEHVHTG